MKASVYARTPSAEESTGLCFNYNSVRGCVSKLVKDCFSSSSDKGCSVLEYDFRVKKPIRSPLALPVFSETGLLLATITLEEAVEQPIALLQVRWRRPKGPGELTPGVLLLTAFDSEHSLLPLLSRTGLRVRVEMIASLPDSEERQEELRPCLAYSMAQEDERSGSWSCLPSTTETTEGVSKRDRLSMIGNSLAAEDSSTSEGQTLAITVVMTHEAEGSTTSIVEWLQLQWLILAPLAVFIGGAGWILVRLRWTRD